MSDVQTVPNDWAPLTYLVLRTLAKIPETQRILSFISHNKLYVDWSSFENEMWKNVSKAFLLGSPDSFDSILDGAKDLCLRYVRMYGEAFSQIESGLTWSFAFGSFELISCGSALILSTLLAIPDLVWVCAEGHSRLLPSHKSGKKAAITTEGRTENLDPDKHGRFSDFSSKLSRAVGRRFGKIAVSRKWNTVDSPDVKVGEKEQVFIEEAAGGREEEDKGQNSEPEADDEDGDEIANESEGERVEGREVAVNVCMSNDQIRNKLVCSLLYELLPASPFSLFSLTPAINAVLWTLEQASHKLQYDNLVVLEMFFGNIRRDFVWLKTTVDRSLPVLGVATLATRVLRCLYARALTQQTARLPLSSFVPTIGVGVICAALISCAKMPKDLRLSTAEMRQYRDHLLHRFVFFCSRNPVSVRMESISAAPTAPIPTPKLSPKPISQSPSKKPVSPTSNTTPVRATSTDTSLTSPRTLQDNYSPPGSSFYTPPTPDTVPSAQSTHSSWSAPSTPINANNFATTPVVSQQRRHSLRPMHSSSSPAPSTDASSPLSLPKTRKGTAASASTPSLSSSSSPSSSSLSPPSSARFGIPSSYVYWTGTAIYFGVASWLVVVSPLRGYVNGTSSLSSLFEAIEGEDIV